MDIHLDITSSAFLPGATHHITLPSLSISGAKGLLAGTGPHVLATHKATQPPHLFGAPWHANDHTFVLPGSQEVRAMCPRQSHEL